MLVLEAEPPFARTRDTACMTRLRWVVLVGSPRGWSWSDAGSKKGMADGTLGMGAGQRKCRGMEVMATTKTRERWCGTPKSAVLNTR
eukprot:11065771-Alexandrium_andersonii.AAC.1